MPKPRLRERILTYGGPGSGKTNAWMRLAKHLPDSTFYVIDTEIGAERSLQEYPEIENVVVYPVIDWTDYRKAQKEIMLKATANDWMVLDMASAAWKAVQRDFINQIFDQDMGDYFMQARKKLKKGAESIFGGKDSVLKGWTDWPVINSRYEDFIMPLVYRSKSNLFIASMTDTVSDDDPKDVKALFGPFGVKPAGQKALGHQPDTLLLFQYTSLGWTMTTVKDRGGRKYMDHVKVIDFYYQYGKIAGWY